MPEEELEFDSSALEDQARLYGVRLAARTLEHHLANDLTLAVGYAELIAEDPEIPERLRDMARVILESARAAVGKVRQMRHIDRLDYVEAGIPGGPLIELGQSPKR